MTYQIRNVAVLGAGVMGAAIAAHLANVDIPSLLKKQ
jgi:3-hydroxyacyl-CoA dehydrogenase